MNSKERRKYWLQFIRQQRIIEQQYTPRIQRVLERQISSLISNAEKVGWQKAYQDMEIINFELMEILRSLYKKTAKTFYPQVKRNIVQKGLGFNQSVIDQIIRFLLEQGLNLVSNMDKVTKDEILQIIFEGEQEGWGFREIADKIASSWIVGYSRALTITRTESMRAANMTMLKAANDQKFVVDKIWVSAKDSRVRMNEKKDEFDHWDLDGVQIPEGEKFRQVGRTGRLAEAMHPGDPTAPPGFTINCRCVLAFENKRDSNGRLIRKQ